MLVTQSQNVPLSCLSRPLADRLAEAAYRDILGLSYARAFSAEWNTSDHGAYLAGRCLPSQNINKGFESIIQRFYKDLATLVGV